MPGTSPYHFSACETFGPRGPGLSNPTSFLRPALPGTDNRRQRQRLVMVKTEHGIFVKFKKPSKTAVPHCRCHHLGYSVPPANHLVPKRLRRSVMMILNLSESLAKPLVMAKLNMAYLSSLKNRAKLLSSSLPVSPSRVLRAPGTFTYHLVPKHLRATWPRPEQILSAILFEKR